MKGKLVKELNRLTDEPSKNDIVEEVRNPFGSGISDDTRLILELYEAHGRYGDNLRYELLPEKDDNSYNSNSYTSGLRKAVGATVPQKKWQTDGYYPGLTKPTPIPSKP